MSHCTIAIVAANRAVNAPSQATMSAALSETLRNTFARTRRNTPAVTIVAAWMSADTGVGPSIASGSQTWSGNCALLPIAPRNSNSAIAVAAVFESPGASANAPSGPA